jgi:hypothetical protein
VEGRDDERRVYARLPVKLEVRWESASGEHRALTGDLAMGGCFIETEASAAAGDSVTVRLRQRSGRWLRLRGVVAYCRPCSGIGVSFVGMGEAERTAVAELIVGTGPGLL